MPSYKVKVERTYAVTLADVKDNDAAMDLAMEFTRAPHSLSVIGRRLAISIEEVDGKATSRDTA